MLRPFISWDIIYPTWRAITHHAVGQILKCVGKVWADWVRLHGGVMTSLTHVCGHTCAERFHPSFTTPLFEIRAVKHSLIMLVAGGIVRSVLTTDTRAVTSNEKAPIIISLRMDNAVANALLYEVNHVLNH